MVVVPNIVGSMTTNISEDEILNKSFEFLYAFDEVITAGGYREPITLQQVRTNMEMESHEEKLHNMIKISKMESAKDQAVIAARAIKDKQKEQSKFGGLGSSNNSFQQNYEQETHSTNQPTVTSSTVPSNISPAANNTSNNRTSSRQPVKGMSLTSAGAKNKSAEDALMKEDKLAPLISTSKSTTNDSSQPGASATIVAQQPITLSIVEKVSASLSRDGMVESFEIKGSLTLTAADDDAALCSVQLKPATVKDSIFSFNTHPKVNKAVYEKTGLLQLKEANKGFPSARPVGILKWTHSGNSEDLIPLKINCWPEEESRNQMNVSIEYSMDVLNMELHDVRIVIPLGTTIAPSILNIDGNYKHNSSAGELVWEIDLIDKSNTTGSLEFTLQQRNPDVFFPITVQFSSQKLYCSVDVVSVNSGSTNAPMVYGLTKSMSTEEYIVK